MILSTTDSLDGATIIEYRGIVFGEAISGINFMKDFTAGFTNFLGGRARGYEEELAATRTDAINEMVQRAERVGANALIGVKVDVESIASGDRGQVMIMVVATGTAVVMG